MRATRAPLHRFVAYLVLALACLGARSVAAAEPAHPRHVPEPMHIDLVRGLGPERGELEVNVLGTVPISGRDHGVQWAPEIEWAPTRDLGIELELDLHDVQLDAVKLSTQGSRAVGAGICGGGSSRCCRRCT